VQGEIADPDGELAGRYRLPSPRLELRGGLLERARAAADVSDGLVADAGHIAAASGVAMVLDLERLPLSRPAQLWLGEQTDRHAGLIRLATAGDDYEIVAAFGDAPPDGFTAIGRVATGGGVIVHLDGRPVDTGASGWRHF
jgi:thiamine-monophosphate kinase